MSKHPFFRLFGGLAALSMMGLIIALLLLTLTSWQARQLVGPARLQADHIQKIQNIVLAAQQLLLRQLTVDNVPSLQEIEKIRSQIDELINADGSLHISTPDRLANAIAALQSFGRKPRDTLIATLDEISLVLVDETSLQKQLAKAADDFSHREFWTALAALVLFPAVIGSSFFLFRRQLFFSLMSINELLDRLSSRDFTPAPLDNVDPYARVVIENYNDLVVRLDKAEKENIKHRQDLETQIRTAIQTVVQQQGVLSNLDRLAAMGEMSASIAHEMRNPLAGMEVALDNLRADCIQGQAYPNPQLENRFDAVINEVQRITRLLTSLLPDAYSRSEQPTPVHISSFLVETMDLARYQASPNVTLKLKECAEVRCLLPADSLRQIVFNLLLNAVQALGEDRGRVELSATMDNDHLTLIVEDSGPGFPAHMIATGPRPFVSSRPSGTGLGLVTARRITRSMGGQIEYSNKSAPQSGAIVKLTLPCRACNV